MILQGQAEFTYLDETSVDQDTGAEGVEDAADDVRSRAVRVVRRADAEADGNSCATTVSIPAPALSGSGTYR